MYFDKRSPLINYIVEATIVYSIAAVVVLVAVAGEKDQTTTTSSILFVVCGRKCCIEVRLEK
jgi:hypothetical protein